MEIKNYKNIIWDWNGTLFNDVYLCSGIMNYLLSERKLPKISIDRYREIFTFPVKEYYIKAGHNFKEESFEKIGMDFIIEYEKKKLNCSLYPFAKEVLKKFQKLNMNQYLLSAYKQDNLVEIIKHYHIFEYFTSIRGLDHVYADGKFELGKQLVSEISANGNSSSTLLIGDTIHDFEVADELGIDCILISDGHQDEKRLNKLNTQVFRNLESLYLLLY